ncbi:MAG: Lrp/AsnC family transcriptional regulator [Oceanococcus sp.]
MDFDRAERGIIQTLQDHGRMTNAELAKAIGSSESPCYRKVRKLEEQGVIRGYRAIVDQRLLGLPITAFVQVSIDKGNDSSSTQFLQRVQAEEHIIECHAMSGHADFLLKVVASDLDHFSRICMQGILRYPGVKDLESHFSLQVMKSGAALPV